MRDTAVERLFSLFTSSDCAEGLAGDLVEERAQRGWTWYWLHVVRVTFTLCRRTAAEAPLRVLALILAACALFAAPAFGGLAAVYLFPQVVGGAASWVGLSFFWWGGALWTGATLAAVAPRRGMAACAILAVFGTALLIALGVRMEPRELHSPATRMFFTVAMGIAVALVAGGAVARRCAIVAAAPLAVAVGLAATVLFVIAGASPSSAHFDEWRDPSPHERMLVTVEDDVRLEVLDWGGSGLPLLLLAGLSDTAHVFDDVAPVLAMRHRVVGVTRRGHPGSSAPATGYTPTQLAEDIVRVMDAAGVRRAVVIGHSWAGEEMHVLGDRYSSRIAGLVYVDAAFDRADRFVEHEAAARELPPPPAPKRADLASFTTLSAYLTRTYGPRAGNWPEARLRTRYVANRDGTVRGPWTPAHHVLDAYSNATKALSAAYEPKPIHVPALAIYAVPKSPDELMRPWYDPNDRVVRKRVEALYSLERENVARHAKWFLAFAERARVAELSGGHDLFVSNPREVIDQIEAFVAGLIQGRPTF